MKRKGRRILWLFIMFTGVMTIFLGQGGTVKKAGASAIGIVKSSGGTLNVRTGPGTTYSKVTVGKESLTLSKGTSVTITAANGSWYHIQVSKSGKTYKGYVAKKYISVQTGKVVTAVYGVANETMTIRKTASVSGQAITVGGKVLALPKAKKVRILSEKMVGSSKWYSISVTLSKKKYKGYILSKKVTLTCEKGLPGVIKHSTPVKLRKTAGSKTQVKVGSQSVSVKNKSQLTILSQHMVSGKKYLKVQVVVDKKTVNGYIQDKFAFLQIVKKEESTANTNTSETSQMTDTEFKKHLKTLGFPEDYITPLVKLHAQYPLWEFQPYNTGLSWSAVISGENKVGLNLLPNSKSYAWKSTDKGAYDWTTDKYIPFDGSTWVTASKKALKYYMDPRNFLDDRGIFQFESLAYQSKIHTQDGVENILKNTPMYKKTYMYEADGVSVSKKYSATFMAAAKESGVSPYHLASRSKQEVAISSTLMSSSVSGNVSGYKGIYNFYNIGAYNSTTGNAITNGLKWASTGTTYLRPWDSPYKSIVGGGSYIGKNYINVGQNTLYLQKFNVTANNRYAHQYMGNIEAPNSEATKTKAAYGTDLASIPLVFSIPIYSDMPASPCAIPGVGKNPNNYLKSLTLSAGSLSPKFTLGDDGSKEYRVTFGNSVSSVNISAKPVASTSTITGTGTKKLSVGTTTYTVKVTSASGKSRSYKIKITRKAA